jgi:hypothetical protein
MIEIANSSKEEDESNKIALSMKKDIAREFVLVRLAERCDKASGI